MTVLKHGENVGPLWTSEERVGWGNDEPLEPIDRQRGGSETRHPSLR